MQYATPQFIEEEGKIISFLTFRQFFWLVGAGGFCILWYYIFPTPLFAIASLITALLIAGIAFVKINNVSLIKIFLNFLGFTMGAKSYIWKKKESAYPFHQMQKTPQPNAPQEIEAPKVQQSKLQSIRTMIDTKR